LSEKTFRLILFVALLLTAPALLFLVQAFLVVPPVFLLAWLLYMLKKSVVSGFGMENLTFIAFFLIHLLVFGGLYWLLALVLGKVAKLVPRGAPRTALLIALLAGLAGLTQLPIYGGGGHGPARLGPLQHLLAELERSYGSGSMLAAYLTAAGLLGAMLAWRRWRNGKRGGPTASPQR